jgi:hypothetical protein
MNRKIALSITEGRVVRDLFENGLLDLLRENNVDVMCFTPAARVPAFVSQWSQPNVTFHGLERYQLGVPISRALRVRNLFLRHARWMLPLWRRLIPKFVPVQPDLASRMAGAQLAVLTHPMAYGEMPIYRAAADLRLPALGILRSWDNLYKGLHIMPDTLCVWNEVNRDETVRMMGYAPDKVRVVGGAQFDPYFAGDSAWTREQFAAFYDLDAARPVIVLATLGAFLPLYDETYLADWLLAAIQDGSIPGKPQVVIRLHPASKYEQFKKYASNPDVRISFIQGYIPSLGWTMTRADVVAVSNLLRHAELIVSPGSTITIESAIFDTPTIVPLFHTYQPELGKQQYEFHLRSHFKRLYELDLVPFVNTPEDLLFAINRALADKSWYRAQRLQLVRDYIHFTDGRSIQRLAELMIGLMKGNNE